MTCKIQVQLERSHISHTLPSFSPKEREIQMNFLTYFIAVSIITSVALWLVTPEKPTTDAGCLIRSILFFARMLILLFLCFVLMCHLVAKYQGINLPEL